MKHTYAIKYIGPGNWVVVQMAAGGYCELTMRYCQSFEQAVQELWLLASGMPIVLCTVQQP